MSMTLFHGGVAGKQGGDLLDGSGPPHVTDNCPACVARASGRVCTVGEYVRWLMTFRTPAAERLIRTFEGVPWDSPFDPPSERQAVYMTTDRDYARYYAATRKGDLYRVEAIGSMQVSETDHFPTWTADSARIVAVLERNVRLQRADRRLMARRWKRADSVADRRKLSQAQRRTA